MLNSFLIIIITQILKRRIQHRINAIGQSSLAIDLTEECPYYYNPGFFLTSSARCVGGLGVYPPPPSGASQPPKFVLTSEKIVKISQKYIAGPLWFSQESSTANKQYHIVKNAMAC